MPTPPAPPPTTPPAIIRPASTAPSSVNFGSGVTIRPNAQGEFSSRAPSLPRTTPPKLSDTPLTITGNSSVPSSVGRGAQLNQAMLGVDTQKIRDFNQGLYLMDNVSLLERGQPTARNSSEYLQRYISQTSGKEVGPLGLPIPVIRKADAMQAYGYNEWEFDKKLTDQNRWDIEYGGRPPSEVRPDLMDNWQKKVDAEMSRKAAEARAEQAFKEKQGLAKGQLPHSLDPKNPDSPLNQARLDRYPKPTAENGPGTGGVWDPANDNGILGRLGSGRDPFSPFDRFSGLDPDQVRDFFKDFPPGTIFNFQESDEPDFPAGEIPGTWTVSITSVGHPTWTATYSGLSGEGFSFQNAGTGANGTILNLMLGSKVVHASWTTAAEWTKPAIVGAAFTKDPNAKPKPSNKPPPKIDPLNLPPSAKGSPSSQPRSPSSQPSAAAAQPGATSARPSLPMPATQPAPSLRLPAGSLAPTRAPGITSPSPSPQATAPSSTASTPTAAHPRTTTTTQGTSNFLPAPSTTSNTQSSPTRTGSGGGGACNFQPDTQVTVGVEELNVVLGKRVRSQKPMVVHSAMGQFAQESMKQFADIKESLNKLENNSKVQRVVLIVQTATMIHNAAMLSQNLAETFIDMISTAATAFGRWTNMLDPDIQVDYREILGTTFENTLKSILGESRYNELDENFKKYNKIYRASANMLGTMRSMFDTTQSVMETIADNTGRIGNALRKSGVVSENAYGWMNENNNIPDKRRKNFERFSEGLESLENKFSALSSISGDALSIHEDLQQFNESKQELQRNTVEAEPKATPLENNAIKAIVTVAKAESQSPDINPADLGGTD